MNDLSHITPDSPETQPHSIKSWQEIDLTSRAGMRELDEIIYQRLDPITPFTFEYEVGGIYGDEIYVYRTGIDDLNDTCWDSVPAFTNVADAAFHIVRILQLPFHLHYLATGQWRASFVVYPTAEAVESTPALAICFAYLRYTDAAAAGNGGGE